MRAGYFLFMLLVGLGEAQAAPIALAAEETTFGSFWLVSLLSFVIGLASACLAYVFFRLRIERIFERLSRSKAGNFLPKVYHRDSIADRVYGYYLWDRDDGFEWISPYLRELLQLDDSHMRLDSLQLAVGAEDFAAIAQAATQFRRGEIHDFFRVVQATRGQVWLECIGLLREGEDMKPGFTFWFRDVTRQLQERDGLRSEVAGLKERNRQLALLCDTAPFPIWMRKRDLSISYCNAAFADMVEESTQAVVDSHALELNAQVRKLAEEAYAKGVPMSRNLHIIARGARNLFQVLEIPVPGQGGDDPALVGFGLDMSELEQAEGELKRHSNAQTQFLESSASAMAVYGADTRLKSYNNAFVRLWKLDEAWLDGQPTYGDVLEALREKRRLPEQANFPMFKRENIELFTRLIQPHEEYYYLPDGRVLRMFVIPHALGGLLFAYEDVTDRLALERNYNTLIAVQRATLDYLREGVAVFGEDGRLKLYNPEYAVLWQYDAKVLDSEPHVADLVEMARPLLHAGEAWEDFREKVIGHVTARVEREGRMHLSDGKVLDWHAVPLPDGATMITYYDVTDSIIVEETLRDRNKALEEADRVKTQFLASMSYELRSPLTTIMGYSEALGKDYFGPLEAKQKDYVQAINQSSHKLMSLINNILDLASIEAGVMSLNLTRVDIRAMLGEIQSLQQERLRESNLQLAVECPEGIGELVADELRVKQVIFNLLQNAIKFSHPDSVITLGVQEVEDEFKRPAIALWVEDRGEGMSKEDQAQAFERFYRGSSIKSRKMGAGLGLSMVKRFTELHGGKVKLSSITGRGTKVTCILPREAVLPLPVPAKKRGGRKTNA